MQNQSKSNQALQKEWPKIVAKAWTDPAFKEKLLKNPKAVLKEYKIEIPNDVEVKITESTNKTFYLNLPKAPEGELSATELEQYAAGAPGPCVVATGHG